jgi:Raf kinase inhibitor-like YbhB/YbcL family protein
MRQRVPRRALACGLIALSGLAAAGCGGDKPSEPLPAAPPTLTLSSPAFRDGGTIPVRFTCNGAGTSPPLAWSGVPADARGLALLVEDPDAPGGTFVHWVLFNIPGGTRALDEGEVPAGARQAKSSTGKAAYTGPCPPKGDAPHHYEFTLYALKSALDLADGAAADDVRAAVAKAALARGRLVGRFGR